ncbi:MAG: iron-containing redox enzyme family protein, partial [Elusimicrobiota bacterium]
GVGLSALYAYESQQPKVSATKIDGLRRHYGIDDKRSLRFFEVHKDIDVWHSEEGRWMIEASGTETPKLHAAVSRSCRALLGFLDGVDERTRLPRMSREAHEARAAREAVPAGC